MKCKCSNPAKLIRGGVPLCWCCFWEMEGKLDFMKVFGQIPIDEKISQKHDN